MKNERGTKMDFMYLVNQDESTEITPRACGKNSPCTGCKGCKGCRGGCKGCTGNLFVG